MSHCFPDSLASSNNRISLPPSILGGVWNWGYTFGNAHTYLVVTAGNHVIFYKPATVTGVVSDDPGIPARPVTFRLGTPYPNPFNATVRIPVEARIGSRLLITVYNTLGCGVMALFDADVLTRESIMKWQAGGFCAAINLNVWAPCSENQHPAGSFGPSRRYLTVSNVF